MGCTFDQATIDTDTILECCRAAFQFFLRGDEKRIIVYKREHYRSYYMDCLVFPPRIKPYLNKVL